MQAILKMASPVLEILLGALALVQQLLSIGDVTALGFRMLNNQHFASVRKLIIQALLTRNQRKIGNWREIHSFVFWFGKCLFVYQRFVRLLLVCGEKRTCIEILSREFGKTYCPEKRYLATTCLLLRF